MRLVDHAELQLVYRVGTIVDVYLYMFEAFIYL